MATSKHSSKAGAGAGKPTATGVGMDKAARERAATGAGVSEGATVTPPAPGEDTKDNPAFAHTEADQEEGTFHHDCAPPGGRFIVGGRAVNARGRDFTDDAERNLAITAEEREFDAAEGTK